MLLAFIQTVEQGWAWGGQSDWSDRCQTSGLIWPRLIGAWDFCHHWGITFTIALAYHSPLSLSRIRTIYVYVYIIYINMYCYYLFPLSTPDLSTATQSTRHGASLVASCGARPNSWELLSPSSTAVQNSASAKPWTNLWCLHGKSWQTRLGIRFK